MSTVSFDIRQLPKPSNKGWSVSLAMRPDGVVYDYAVIGSGTPGEVYNNIHLGLSLYLDSRFSSDTVEEWLQAHRDTLDKIHAQYLEFGDWTVEALALNEALAGEFEKAKEWLSTCWEPAEFFCADDSTFIYEMVNEHSVFSYALDQVERAKTDADADLDLDEVVKHFEDMLERHTKGSAVHRATSEDLYVQRVADRLRERGAIVDSCFTNEDWDALLIHDGQDWNLAYVPEIEDALDLCDEKQLLWTEACQETQFSARIDKEEEIIVLALILQLREENREIGETTLDLFCTALGIPYDRSE